MTTEHTAQQAQPRDLQPHQIKYDAAGLVPAVIQDCRTGAVLMVGYMDQEALRRTLAGGKVWFWSRSRREYWLKGNTSGNFFSVREIYADCDGDALLVKVELKEGGVACHTGSYSCFFNPLSGEGARQKGDRSNA